MTDDADPTCDLLGVKEIVGRHQHGGTARSKNGELVRRAQVEATRRFIANKCFRALGGAAGRQDLWGDPDVDASKKIGGPQAADWTAKFSS
ncbi:hypothetical protein [Bradyrhizobium retamae]|uniref:Uncharacterized protein n=1 Tax=Bradyrhizobium retamae TaxID=1300035 RepID=A0A0R3MM01_9BRAD|nr:hypothetical protein [Bradyrhizobium retamae]KRR17846.1 hypothetical protein CQ13_10720 [Bradyrhizobium retamae]